MSLRTRGSRFRNFKSVWFTIEGFMTVRYPALSIKGFGVKQLESARERGFFDRLKLTFDHEQPCFFSETFKVVHEAVGVLKGVYWRGFGLAEGVSVHPSKNSRNPDLNHQQRRVDGFQHLPRQGSSLRKCRRCGKPGLCGGGRGIRRRELTFLIKLRFCTVSDRRVGGWLCSQNPINCWRRKLRTKE